MHDDIRAVVAAVGRVDFALDVVLNREQRIVEAFGGSLLGDARRGPRGLAAAGDAAGAGAVRRRGHHQRRLPARPEPLPGGEGHVGRGDRWCSPAGPIVCAAECRDGFPDHGSYREVLASAASPEALLDDDRGAGAHRARTSGRCRCRPRCRRRPGSSCTPSYLADDDLASAHLGHTDGRRGDRRGVRWPRPGRTPGCACCPRARRLFPTSASCVTARSSRRRRRGRPR